MEATVVGAKRWAALALGLAAGSMGCAREEPAELSALLGQVQQAAFINGDFETGTHNAAPPSWTVNTFLNPGVTVQNPQTREGLNLSAGGTGRTYTYLTASGPETQWDPNLGSGSSLRWPKYGTGVAVVNYRGTSRNVNALVQKMLIAPADIDPADGKAHVRFTVAPVLENPGHTASQQPYYFVQLKNLTRNTILYRDYNASAQPGVPWKVASGLYYTDWQLVDIAPGSAQLAIGDEVELEVMAAGCSPSAHYGHVYVDGVGSTVPGLFVAATGPAAANAGTDITYDLTYNNGGTGDAGDVVVKLVTPANTTFRSVSTPVGGCTSPAVGATGTVSCDVGLLQPGASRSLQITVRINAGASGLITNGNYSVQASNSSALLGPKVFTTITSGVTYADLAIQKTNDLGGVAWGSPVSYTITATNYGPSAVTGATVTDTLPPQLTGALWTCAGSDGGQCAAAGTGNIADTVNLPVGGKVTYTLNASVIAGSGSGTLSNTAAIALPAGASDPNPTNNADADVDPIGELRTVTLTKAGTGSGAVVSSPAAIACGSGCSGASGQFLQGATVVLSANPAFGHTFAGWSGACTGTGQCTLTLADDRAVTANFTAPLAADGELCAQGVECLSGNCVDGVCCDTSCGGGVSDCQACNVAGKVGSCTPLPQGTECRASAGACDLAESCDGASAACPDDARKVAGTECRAAAGVCDVAESCDGLGALCPLDAFVAAGTTCRGSAGLCDVVESCTGSSAACPDDGFEAAGTACRSASCNGSIATLAASCSGAAASCPSLQTESCGDFACGATACLGSCVSDAHCQVGNYCSEGSCESKLGLGEACYAGAQCLSGECTDGVCCDSTCLGQCESCNEAGSAGTCTPTVGAPRAGRPACATDGSLCGGQCDGKHTASCSFPSASVVCRAASCASGVATLESSCDGGGSCPASPSESCGQFACGETQCLGDCSAHGDCQSGSFCSAGVCKEKRLLGEACSAGAQCGSGFCADGVCCDSGCGGQCQACGEVGSLGTCTTISGEPRGGRPACASDGSACGGACDGTQPSACTFPSGAVVCRAAKCSESLATLEASCDGAGSCPDEQTQSCMPFGCGEKACLGDCQVDADCLETFWCAAGVCQPKRDLGQSCSGDAQCTSDSCVDGVCCESACGGQCEACDVAGLEGLCSAVSGAPHGGRPACASDGSDCGGSCDGSYREGCAYPASETACRAAGCSDGTATAAAACDGAGACPAPELTSCGEYACGADACLGDCSDSSACAASHFCQSGMCQPKRELGEACSTLEQCGSGQCVDGVCCESACDSQCAACNEPGKAGTCTTVSGAPRGGRAACAGQGSCAGACDGTSADACAFPGADTSCSEATCADGKAKAAANCDGEGSCKAGAVTQCGSGCGGSSCSPAVCTANAQCGSGQVCEDGACVVLGSSHAADTAAGCGCSTPGTSRSPAWLLFLVAAAAVLLRRRHGEDRAARG